MGAYIKDYTEAVVPNTTKILGTTLLPFSLGHLIIMKKMNLCWVQDDSCDPSIMDFFLGLFICSQTWEEYNNWKKELNTWETIPIVSSITKWLKEHEYFYRYDILKRFYYMKWENDIRNYMFALEKSIKNKEFNIMQHIVMFNKYIQRAQKHPKYTPTEKANVITGDVEVVNGKDSYIENIITTLTGECGYKREDVLNMPIGNAIFDYLKYCERNGMVELDKTDEDFIKECIKRNKNLCQS